MSATMRVPEGDVGADSAPPVVWVVDDSDLQAEVCRAALAESYEVRIFTDGMTMLEALSEATPELIVLDWQMPNLSGTDLCRFIRETHDPGALPILILTATSGDNLPEAFAAGANDFVRKPFSRTELLARVRGLVRNRQIHARLAAVERRLRVEGEFRERFIAMLAHDLRQPLNTFIVANGVLGHTLASESGSHQRLVDMQGRTAQRMSRMIAELLDFARSRPQTGMPIERENLDFEPVVRAAVEEMRIANPTRTFEVTVEGGCEGRWDRDRMAQVCSNLIGNAVEHSSDASPIEISVRCADDRVELRVVNQGEPIPPELLPTLFEPYRRGRETAGAKGGLGLGLHIVREIARAHGGTVAAESDARRTAFIVTLPMQPV